MGPLPKQGSALDYSWVSPPSSGFRGGCRGYGRGAHSVLGGTSALVPKNWASGERAAATLTTRVATIARGQRVSLDDAITSFLGVFTPTDVKTCDC